MNPTAPPQRPLYFLHLHKCGGSTFLQAAAANGHLFPCPGNGGMPFPAKRWAAMPQPFVRAGPVWEFWKEPRLHIVERKIRLMLKAGITCITQEWGHYSPDLWRRFTRAVCVRHPIDRLYSDFLHQQENVRFPAELTFQDWAWEERPGLHPTLFLDQLGKGDLATALDELQDFHVIIVQERYPETLGKMKCFGWDSTDAEKHFKSWTARRKISGREALAAHPHVIRRLSERCAADIQIYERAVELALDIKLPA